MAFCALEDFGKCWKIWGFYERLFTSVLSGFPAGRSGGQGNHHGPPSASHRYRRPGPVRQVLGGGKLPVGPCRGIQVAPFEQQDMLRQECVSTEATVHPPSPPFSPYQLSSPGTPAPDPGHLGRTQSPARASPLRTRSQKQSASSLLQRPRPRTPSTTRRC